MQRRPPGAPKKRVSEARRYTLWGVFFGLLFPVGSLIVVHLTLDHDHSSSLPGIVTAIADAHVHNPLLYVIDTAPLFLGWLSWLAGVRQDRVRRILSGLEREVLDKTRSLRQALIDAEQANHLIAKMAAQDALTGLMNRRRMQDEIDRWTAHSRRYSRHLALLYIDLDHFKHINDHFGHAAGDQLLSKMGQLLRSSFRGTDFVARWGGDEFVVMLPEADGDGAAMAADKLIGLIKAEHLQLGSEVMQMSASVGIALFPGDTDNVDELMRFADRAMYAAKGAGGNRWCRHGQAPAGGDGHPVAPSLSGTAPG